MILYFSHLLILNEEQRYMAATGIDFSCVGVCLFSKLEDKLKYLEIMCEYDIITSIKDNQQTKIKNNKFIINLPFVEGKENDIPIETWSKMNDYQKEYHYMNLSPEQSSKRLKNLDDNGCECWFYQEHNVITLNNKNIKTVHQFNIIDEQFYIDSLDYIEL